MSESEDAPKPSKITFSREISLGHVIMLGGILASAVSVYTTSIVRMGSQDNRLAALEKIAMGQSDFNKSLVELLAEMRSTLAL